MKTRARWIAAHTATPLLLAAIALLVYSVSSVRHLVGRVDQFLDGARMQTVTHKWTSGGDEIVVSTTRDVGEALDAWVARHAAAVAAMKTAFPKDE